MKTSLICLILFSLCFAEQKQDDSASDSSHILLPKSIGPTTQFQKSSRFRMQEYNYFLFGLSKKSPTMEYKNQVKILFSMQFNFFNFTYDSLQAIVKFKKTTKNFNLYRSLNIDVGYRQKSFWNIYDDSTSRPMYDNNYSPSFYISWITYIKKISLPISILAGYVHESNGGATFLNPYCPTISRSWDRIYLGASAGNLQVNLVTFQLDMWVPFGLEENLDIYKHYGIGEITLYYQPFFEYQHSLSNFGLSIAWKIASENFNNAELSLFFSPFQFAKNKILRLFTPTFYSQLYLGSGENLVDYQTRHVSLRIGLATLF
jgi:outer membrane phospholipase A